MERPDFYELKGVDFPEAVSFDDRYGGVPAFGPEMNQTAPSEGGNRPDAREWVETAAEILPDLYCMIFPKKCQGQERSNRPPVVVQQAPQRDWLMIGLLVVIVVVLLVLILKK